MQALEADEARPGTWSLALGDLARSSYDMQVYREAAEHRSGLGFKVLFCLVVLAWLPLGLRFGYDSLSSYGEADEFVEGFPTFELRDGQILTDVATPFVWTTDGFTFILDPDGVAEVPGPPAVVLRNGEGELVQSRGRRRMFPLESWSDVSLDLASAADWVRIGTIVALVVLPPAAILWSLLWRGILGFVWGALVAAAAGVKRDAGYRVAMLAVAPSVWLSSLLDVFGVAFSGQSAVMYLVMSCYLALAVRSVRVGAVKS